MGSYTQTEWVAGVTPLSEANMDHLEEQYDAAVTDLGLVVATTEVFSGNSPNPSAWTDLDISAVVGSNIALVLFKVYNNNAAASIFLFRINGDAEPANTSTGPNKTEVQGTSFGYALCATDSSGVVEWYMNRANEANTTIDVVAYIPNAN